MAFDKNLLEVLACPVCKGKLSFNAGTEELICAADRLAYPVREDIPVMLENEARKMSGDELDKSGK